MRGKDTFTLRIPTETNKSIREMSEITGISQNSLILLFIDCGMQCFTKIPRHQVEEFRRWLSQNQK